MKKVLINIRGTNGSGKTTLVRDVLRGSDSFLVRPFGKYLSPTKKDPKRTKEGFISQGSQDYHPYGSVVAIGDYNKVNGGMDYVPTFSIGMGFIEEALKTYNCVLAESVLMSTVFGKDSWCNFFKERQSEGVEVVIAYLNTPEEVIRDRILQRRLKGNTKSKLDFDSVLRKVPVIQKTKARYEEEGIRTIELDYRDPLKDLCEKIPMGL